MFTGGKLAGSMCQPYNCGRRSTEETVLCCKEENEMRKRTSYLPLTGADRQPYRRRGDRLLTVVLISSIISYILMAPGVLTFLVTVCMHVLHLTPTARAEMVMYWASIVGTLGVGVLYTSFALDSLLDYILEHRRSKLAFAGLWAVAAAGVMAWAVCMIGRALSVMAAAGQIM